jgi:hypothetical protein
MLKINKQKKKDSSLNMGILYKTEPPSPQLRLPPSPLDRQSAVYEMDSDERWLANTTTGWQVGLFLSYAQIVCPQVRGLGF